MIEAIGIKEPDKDFRVVNSAAFRGECNKLAPGRYRIKVEKMRKDKSLPQLGYYYACVLPMSQKLLNDAGWEITDLAECDAFWKSQFANREVVNRNTGEVMSVPALKRNMTSLDMMTFVDAIRNYCAEFLGGYIPEPGEQTEINYEESEVTQ